MDKHYILFTKHILPQKDLASAVWAAHTANAAANLGYSAVLVYCQPNWKKLNPIDLIFPFRPRKPDGRLTDFYNIQDRLLVAPYPAPWPVDSVKSKLLNASTITCKYILPFHMKQSLQIVHTRNWNFAKAAVKNQVPVIYEQHHYEKKAFEPEIVNNPFFQVAVTLSDTVMESMIAKGMPRKKIIQTHSGMNNVFLRRQPKNAEQWRQKLLGASQKKHLVVYSGGLYRFKGVDLLIEVATHLPELQFVFAGGKEPQIKEYQELTRKHQATNVTFLGYLPQYQLASLLQAADVLAHPHLSGEAATFTSPLKFFDYLGSGTPIVLTKIPPLREFQSANLVAGWCEPDSPIQFVRAIQEVLAKYPRHSQGYKNNLQFAGQFSCENRVSRILTRVDESLQAPQVRFFSETI